MDSETSKLLPSNVVINDVHTRDVESEPSTNGTDEENTLGGSQETDTQARKWSRNQILTAVSLSLMNISLSISFGIISPFYPTEAAKKGATPTEVGLVFGVFQLIMFITAPIYGTYIQKIGARYMFLSGSFILGGCSIAFGFLDKCPDGTIYVVMCFVCRSIEANGCSMLATASFAIMACTFPDNVGQAVGILEIFSGLGMVLGPSIGGGLYGVGGYLLPFIVIGALVWCTTIISHFILPRVDEVPRVTGSIFSLLKIPGCIVIYLIILGCGMSLSFLDPTFSPWMKDTFNSTTPQIGLVFMVSPGVYALTAPLSGYLSDQGFHTSVSLVGLFLVAVSFVFLGPNPLLAKFIKPSIGETIVTLVVLGASVGAAVIPVFALTLMIARSRGFEDNLQTYGLVSGFFQSGFALGAFVGPTAAGYLAGQYGFAWSSSVCGFINGALALLFLIFVLVMRYQDSWPPKMPEEKESDGSTQSLVDSSGSSLDYGSINA